MALISKKVMNFAYGMGAAVVIVGALFKIQHYPGAGELLIVGLLTEAFIFGLSALKVRFLQHVWYSRNYFNEPPSCFNRTFESNDRFHCSSWTRW